MVSTIVSDTDSDNVLLLISAPLNWWHDFDKESDDFDENTHRVRSYVQPITIDDFDVDDSVYTLSLDDEATIADAWESMIKFCELLRKKYNETQDSKYIETLFKLMPLSWVHTQPVYIKRKQLGEICKTYHDKDKNWKQFCEVTKYLY